MQANIKYKFSFLHRFLHWSIALAIIFIFLTVFLRLGWMNKENIGEIILKDLQSKDITITQAEAQGIAKDIRKPMFNWHIYIGYVLTGLYILRLVYIFIKGEYFANLFSHEIRGKNRFQSAIYILFYIGLGIVLLSGFLIVNGPKDYKGILEQIHKPSLFFIIIFFILHLGGILIGEKTDKKGVVSAMINGGRES